MNVNLINKINNFSNVDKSEREKQILDLLMSRKDIRKLVEKSNECYSKMDFVAP